MRSGELRHRVTLQYPTDTADGMGGYTRTWTDDETVFAAIWDTPASATVTLGKQAEPDVTRIRIRYHSTIDSTWRLKWGTTYYAIHSVVNPDKRNRSLDLVCKEAEV